MMKNKGLATGMIAMIFAVYSVLMFVLFGGALPGFWLGYACSIALAGFCVAVIWKGFGSQKSFFMGLPLASLTLIFLIVQLLLSFVVALLPFTLALIAEVILLGLCLVCSLGALLGRHVVEGREQEIKEKVFYIQSIAANLEGLASLAPDADIQKKLNALYETVRYSDPMSNDSLAPIERRIEEQAAVLSEQVNSKDWESVSSLCGTLTHLVEERNRKCRLLK
jgi:hypothetical protein